MLWLKGDRLICKVRLFRKPDPGGICGLQTRMNAACGGPEGVRAIGPNKFCPRNQHVYGSSDGDQLGRFTFMRRI